MGVGVEVDRVSVLSSSSWRECSDLKDPKRLDGLAVFCKLRGLDLGINRSMLALEFNLFREVGLDSAASPLPSFGEPDKGLEEKVNGVFRCFFGIVTGGALSGGSSIGVRAEMGGRKMLKLFLRRFSDMMDVKARGRAKNQSQQS